MAEAENDPLLQSLMRTALRDVVSGERSLADVLGYTDKQLLELAEVGNNLLNAGKFDKALKVFKGLIALDPNVPVFHMNAGLAASMSDDYEAARGFFDSALSCAETVPGGEDIQTTVLIERGRMLLRAGEAESASDDLQRALAMPEGAISEEQRAQAQRLLDNAFRAAEAAAAQAEAEAEATRAVDDNEGVPPSEEAQASPHAGQAPPAEG